MSTKVINTTIELLGKIYPIRCPESEIPALEEAAAYLNEKMLEVQASGKVFGMDRIAIITALNVASNYLSNENQKNRYMHKINQRICQLQDKLDNALQKIRQTELIYTAE